LNRNYLYALIPFLIAVALRVYPYMVSGLPFSTDAWAPVRNTELLLEYTPIPLNDEIFDGYNNYWPANSLFGAVISEATGITPIDAMALFLPVVGATTVLIFYALVKRLYDDVKVAFVASLIFGTAFQHAFFTAGVTKETCANPLYVLLILVFLHPAIGKPKQVFLFAIVSVTLVLAHHLTSLMAVLILLSIALANLVVRAKNGLTIDRSNFLLVLIPLATASVYYVFYAQAGFAMPFTFSEWLSVAAYQLLAFAAAAYLMYQSWMHTRGKILIISLVAVVSVFLYILLTLSVTIVTGFTPSVQEHILLYISPYFIALPFITLGYAYSRGNKGTLATLFWLAPLMGLEAYAVFGNYSLSAGIWVRNPNFFILPAAILAATGLYWVYKKAKGFRLAKLIKPAVVAVTLAMVTINIYSLYASVSLQDRYMGYHWLYTIPEFKAGAWVAEANNNQTVAGDMKVSYLLHDYFAVNVDTLQGYRYLTADSTTQPSLLFTYRQMLKNGYVLGPHGVDLPENWTEQTSQLNRIYSSGFVSLYAK